MPARAGERRSWTGVHPGLVQGVQQRPDEAADGRQVRARRSLSSRGCRPPLPRVRHAIRARRRRAPRPAEPAGLCTPARPPAARRRSLPRLLRLLRPRAARAPADSQASTWPSFRLAGRGPAISAVRLAHVAQRLLPALRTHCVSLAAPAVAQQRARAAAIPGAARHARRRTAARQAHAGGRVADGRRGGWRKRHVGAPARPQPGRARRASSRIASTGRLGGLLSGLGSQRAAGRAAAARRARRVEPCRLTRITLSGLPLMSSRRAV